MKPEPKRKDIIVDGFLDIETEQWDRFLCGCLVRSTGEVIIRDFRHEYDLIVEILARPGVFWTWNGGRYDALWFAEWITKLGLKAEIFVAGQSITCLRLPEFSVELRDAARLVPMSLEKAGNIAGVSKLKTGFDCVCGTGCGGYCQFTRGMPGYLLKRVSDYMVVDAEVGMAILEAIRTYACEKDLDLCGTIGASAWRTAKRWSGLPKAEWPSSGYYEFARRGYYGGRVNVFRARAASGFRYDINSAYPAALAKTPLPYGPMAAVDGRDAAKAFADGREGIYEAECVVQRQFVPPLPVRLPDRIAYPVGRVSGTWTRIELENAIHAGKTKITKFGSAIVWQTSEAALAYFSTRVWELRHEAIAKNKLGKSGGLPSWLKWFANSATGKLAQRPDSERVVCNPSPESIRGCPADFECGQGIFHGIKRCCRHRCVGNCGRAIPLDGRGEMRIWSIPVFRIPDCGHVEWAAYLTAATRIELFRQLTADGNGGFTSVYCDTDSCYATEPRTTRIGSGLGEWQAEGTFSEFVALAPKVYAYQADGKLNVKAKGIPFAEKVWDKISTGQRIEINRGVQTFKTAAREGNLFMRKHAHRHIANVAYGDRELVGDITYPKEMGGMK